MRNLINLLPFVLFTAMPNTQNTNKTTKDVVLNEKVEEIIQHKADSLILVAYSLRDDVQEIKSKQDRIKKLLEKEKELDIKLQEFRNKNQQKYLVEQTNL